MENIRGNFRTTGLSSSCSQMLTHDKSKRLVDNGIPKHFQCVECLTCYREVTLVQMTEGIAMDILFHMNAIGGAPGTPGHSWCETLSAPKTHCIIRNLPGTKPRGSTWRRPRGLLLDSAEDPVCHTTQATHTELVFITVQLMNPPIPIIFIPFAPRKERTTRGQLMSTCRVRWDQVREMNDQLRTHCSWDSLVLTYLQVCLSPNISSTPVLYL